jgi:protein phosphatase
VKVDVGSATDIGRVRERNEDSVLVEPPLYVVADGMGGHRGGDVASQIAVETMEELGASDRGSLADHVRHANLAVWKRSMEDERVSGMGTTLTAVRIDGDSLVLAHVGDSRAYLLRNGSLSKLTTDHTLVERMLRSGEITEEEAEVHPHRNVMTRALGTDEQVEVDEESIVLQSDDVLLLCSDGLTGMVTEDQIQAILEQSDGPQQAADRLVKAANRAGGIDNISVVVLRASGDGAAPPARRVAPPSPKTVARWALRVGVPLLVLLVLGVAGRWYLDRQWYVAPDGGRVAIFQGVPLTILGFDLGHSVQRTTVPADEVAALDEKYPAFADGITVADRDEAVDLVEQMRADVRAARRAEREEQPGAGGGDGGGG